MTKMTKKVEQAQKDGPVRLSKYYLNKAIEKINKYGKKKKAKEHPVIEKHKTSGRRALSMCVSSSVNAMSPQLTPPVQYVRSRNFLSDMLRKSLLNHNWNHSLTLLQFLMEKCYANNGLIVYYFRILLIIMFNIGISDDRIDELLSILFGLRDGGKKKFLKSIVNLSKYGIKKTGMKQK